MSSHEHNHHGLPSGRYSLVDVYNAASHDRNFNYAFWLEVLFQIICTNAFYYFGYFLVACVIILILVLGYSGICIVLPALEVGMTSYLFHVINGIFILFNIYFNYLMSFLTHPGAPSANFILEVEDGLSRNAFCKKCNLPKPPRTHHCSVCRRCVLRMDHHCPYISNCVGHRNYRFFVLFLFWTTIGTGYLSFMSGLAICTKTNVVFTNLEGSEGFFRIQFPSVEDITQSLESAVPEHYKLIGQQLKQGNLTRIYPSKSRSKLSLFF